MTKNTIKIGGITLNKVNQKNSYIPQFAETISMPSKDKKALAIAIKENIPCLLVGETGTGKTSVIKELAYKLKQGYTRISLTGYTSPDELIGSKSASNGSTYYENGILTRAMIEGHIVVLDELNAITPECSFIMHGLLDDDKQITLPNGDIIKPHKDFRLFSTINPEYEGTRSLNRAFLDRFGIIVYVNLLSPVSEIKLLKDRTNADENIIKSLVALAWLNRKAYLENKTLTLISTRSLLQLIKLYNEGLTIKDAYIASVVNKARHDEKTAFMEFYNIIFKTNETTDVNNLPEVITPDEARQRKEELATLKTETVNLRDKIYNLENDISNYKSQTEETRSLNKLLEEKIASFENQNTNTANTAISTNTTNNTT